MNPLAHVANFIARVLNVPISFLQKLFNESAMEHDYPRLQKEVMRLMDINFTHVDIRHELVNTIKEKDKEIELINRVATQRIDDLTKKHNEVVAREAAALLKCQVFANESINLRKNIEELVAKVNLAFDVNVGLRNDCKELDSMNTKLKANAAKLRKKIKLMNR